MTSIARRQTLADLLRRSAARTPDKTAIICGDTTLDLRGIRRVVSRLAAGLAAQGVGKGDRIAILARNSHALRRAAIRGRAARRGARADQFHAEGRKRRPSSSAMPARACSRPTRPRRDGARGGGGGRNRSSG